MSAQTACMHQLLHQGPENPGRISTYSHYVLHASCTPHITKLTTAVGRVAGIRAGMVVVKNVPGEALDRWCGHFRLDSCRYSGLTKRVCRSKFCHHHSILADCLQTLQIHLSCRPQHHIPVCDMQTAFKPHINQV